MNTKQQGDIGMGRAIAYFSRNLYTVCIPLADSQEYDLVVGKGDYLYKVQVKTANTPKVYLATCGGNRSGTGKKKHFDGAKVDLLFVAHMDGRDFLVETKGMKNLNSLTLSLVDSVDLKGV